MDRSITTARNSVIAEINKDLKTIKIKQYVAFNDFSPFWSRWEIDLVVSLFGYKTAITDTLTNRLSVQGFPYFFENPGVRTWSSIILRPNPTSPIKAGAIALHGLEPKELIAPARFRPWDLRREPSPNPRPQPLRISLFYRPIWRPQTFKVEQTYGEWRTCVRKENLNAKKPRHCVTCCKVYNQIERVKNPWTPTDQKLNYGLESDKQEIIKSLKVHDSGTDKGTYLSRFRKHIQQ